MKNKVYFEVETADSSKSVKIFDGKIAAFTFLQHASLLCEETLWLFKWDKRYRFGNVVLAFAKNGIIHEV